MRFDILTLFPELFPPFLSAGVTRRAFEAPEGGTAPVETRLWPLRDHAEGNYRRVDDRPFGGGPGMVMLAQPLLRALDAVRADQQAAGPPPPPGVPFVPPRAARGPGARSRAHALQLARRRRPLR